MTTYVLVHGGDRDGSIWSEVELLLRTQGRTVFCPSMTPITQTTLSHNIQEICEVIIKHHLNNIVLVGHSYGAMVITGVMNTLSDKIRYLVYIDSIIPQNGKSLYGLLAEQGVDYKVLGLTPDKPCIEPLYFNEDALKDKSKAYIYCLQSEFIQATTPSYKKLVEASSAENWLHFSLDTIHGCMMTRPQEVAVILNGLSDRTIKNA